MAKDFRASQIRTNKLIASGSTGTGAALLVYPSSIASDNEGGINFAPHAGTDTFVFVSGSISSKDTSEQGVFVIGGDLHVSGNLTIDGSGGGGGGGGTLVQVISSSSPDNDVLVPSSDPVVFRPDPNSSTTPFSVVSTDDAQEGTLFVVDLTSSLVGGIAIQTNQILRDDSELNFDFAIKDNSSNNRALFFDVSRGPDWEPNSPAVIGLHNEDLLGSRQLQIIGGSSVVSTASSNANGIGILVKTQNGGPGDFGGTTGGELRLNAGNGGISSGESGGAGGPIEVTTGTGADSNSTDSFGGPGGSFILYTGGGGSGAPNYGGDGGKVFWFLGGGAAGTIQAGNGGGVDIYAGVGGSSTGGAGGSGGSFTFFGGDGGMNQGEEYGGNGGGITMIGGAGGASTASFGGIPGAIYFQGGGSKNPAQTGGNVILLGGEGSAAAMSNGFPTASKGGAVYISGGDGLFSFQGSGHPGPGGDAVLKGGNAGQLGSPADQDGGNVFILGGTRGASGNDGNLVMAGHIVSINRDVNDIAFSGSIGADTNFIVTGSVNSKGTSTRGTSVFVGDVHISGNLTIDGSGGGGGGGGPAISNTKLHLGSYTTVTQSTPQVTGGGFYVAGENLTTSAHLRIIFSCGNASNLSHVRLFNITSASYVPLDGTVVELNTNSTTPIVLTSSNLIGASNFDDLCVYELHVSASGGGSPLVAFQHSAEIVFFS